jgi:hypothetical protein
LATRNWLAGRSLLALIQADPDRLFAACLFLTGWQRELQPGGQLATGNWQLAKIRIARTSMAKLMEKVQLAPVAFQFFIWRSFGSRGGDSQNNYF